jgi:hypothetical protein
MADGYGIGLLAAGTAGHPDAQGCLGGMFHQDQRLNGLLCQDMEGFRVAKKVGDIDQHLLEERFNLFGLPLQPVDVPVQVFLPGRPSCAARSAAGECSACKRKIVPGFRAQEKYSRCTPPTGTGKSLPWRG